MAKKIVKKCAKHGNLTAKDCYGPFLENRANNRKILRYYCAECGRSAVRRRRLNNPQLLEKERKDYYKKNRLMVLSKGKERKKAWVGANRDRFNEYQRAHHELKKGNLLLMKKYREKYGLD